MTNFQDALDLSLQVKPPPLITENGDPIILEPRPWIKAMIMLAYSRLRNNQVDEAIRDFNESDRHDNNQENPGIFDGLGQCYHKIKEFEKAISYFKMALEKEPKNVDFLVNRALCYYDMQEYESSIDDLN